MCLMPSMLRVESKDKLKYPTVFKVTLSFSVSSYLLLNQFYVCLYFSQVVISSFSCLIYSPIPLLNLLTSLSIPSYFSPDSSPYLRSDGIKPLWYVLLLMLVSHRCMLTSSSRGGINSSNSFQISRLGLK